MSQLVSYTVGQFDPSVFLLCHRWLTTTNLSYRFPIFETSATALCGTTGIYIHTHLNINMVERIFASTCFFKVYCVFGVILLIFLGCTRYFARVRTWRICLPGGLGMGGWGSHPPSLPLLQVFEGWWNIQKITIKSPANHPGSKNLLGSDGSDICNKRNVSRWWFVMI